jgi:hypothetical protein
MTPEERSLLERTHALAEENNKMLRSIKRSGRIAVILRALYWLIIIGISVGAFYFIQPYIDYITGRNQDTSTTSSQSSIAEQIQDLLK